MDERRFENHVATLKDLGEVKILIWEKPGTRGNGMRYVIYEGNLFVSGDFFNTSYSWSSAITFEFLSGLGIDYFHSKMNNLDRGPTWSWDGKKAMDWLKQELEDSEFDEDDKRELAEEADEYSPYEDGWAAFINHRGDELRDDDGYCYRAGLFIPPLVKIHLQGIKMAMAQLRANNKESEAGE